jgi:hypothetical protein
VISRGGVLCYSKNFFEDFNIKEDIFAGFLKGISDFVKEIKGGQIKTLNFRNFNLFYSYSIEFDFIFVIAADKGEIESEVRTKVDLMKSEFIGRYGPKLKDWYGNINTFREFDEFVIDNIVIPPNILLVGTKGVGKKTMMGLFPSEEILDIDEGLNEIPQKIVELPELININHCIIRRIDMEELAYNTLRYKILLISVDIILIVTNSSFSNLRKTKELYYRMKPKVKKGAFYLIANYQDEIDTAFNPEKIEEMFNLKTFGFSALKKDSYEKFMLVLKEIIRKNIEEKFDLE